MLAHLMHHCFIVVFLWHIILYKIIIIPDRISALDPCLALTLLLHVSTRKLYHGIKSYDANSLFFLSHMGPPRRFSYVHPSLALPSLPHLRSPDSPVHRHLTPPPLESRRSSAHLHPLPEESLTEVEFEMLNPGPHRHRSDQSIHSVRDSLHTNANKSCTLCHNRIPYNVEPCTFPATAPAAVAALNPHIPLSTGPKIFCYACWVWIHNLSICWTCGDTVSRKEERVSYGWCWWHWGCVSCLFCRVCEYISLSQILVVILAFEPSRVTWGMTSLRLFLAEMSKGLKQITTLFLQTPMPPPPWVNNLSGIPLQTAPVCKYCAEDLTVLEGSAPSIPPQSPPSPPPSPKPPSRSFPKWMAKLPSNRAKKSMSFHPIPTPTPPPSPQTMHLSRDLGVPSHVNTSSKSLLLTRSLSANIQAKALLRPKAGSPAATRRKPLKRKYGNRVPPYMRGLSTVFSDHRRKVGFRSRAKRRSDEEHDDGERIGEGNRLTDGHGWEDGGGKDLSLERDEEENEEGLCHWGAGWV